MIWVYCRFGGLSEDREKINELEYSWVADTAAIQTIVCRLPEMRGRQGTIYSRVRYGHLVHTFGPFVEELSTGYFISL